MTFRRIYLSPSSGKMSTLLGPINGASPEIGTTSLDWAQLKNVLTDVGDSAQYPKRRLKKSHR
jgi:hypothetical protein